MNNLPDILWGPLNATRGQIALAQGDFERAHLWLDRVQGGYGAAFHYLKLPLKRAKLALAQGDKAAAAIMLLELDQAAVQAGAVYARNEILALLALAAGNEDQALGFLHQALALAQPEGYVRVFVDQGKVLVPLLEKAAGVGSSRATAAGSSPYCRSVPCLPICRCPAPPTCSGSRSVRGNWKFSA